MGIVTDKLAQLAEDIHSAYVNENTLTLGLMDGDSYSIVFMKAGIANPIHKHPHIKSIFLIIAGEGEILKGDEVINYKTGSTVTIEPFEWHQIVPAVDSLIFTIQSPAMKFTDNGWEPTIYK